ARRQRQTLQQQLSGIQRCGIAARCPRPRSRLRTRAGTFHAEAIHINRPAHVAQLENVTARRQPAIRNLIFGLPLRLAQFSNTAFVIDGRPERAIKVDVSSSALRALEEVVRHLSCLTTRYIKVQRGSMLTVIARPESEATTTRIGIIYRMPATVVADVTVVVLDATWFDYRARYSRRHHIAEWSSYCLPAKVVARANAIAARAIADIRREIGSTRYRGDAAP